MSTMNRHNYFYLTAPELKRVQGVAALCSESIDDNAKANSWPFGRKEVTGEKQYIEGKY